ncbi:MAG TPA: hypothetical protein VHW23_15860 [Kofleriaceae bacterium]|jgi:multidrug efflux pump subunit AcrA (membrane-fusion protein)|nr:hypothetical protein [Kofleriaceae bacterium]
MNPLVRALAPVRRLRTRHLARVVRWLLATATVAGSAAGAFHVARRWHAGPADPGDVPTVTVARSRFVRRVTADGNLRAVHATPVMTPRFDGVAFALRLAWLAPDGSPVRAGDVVIRFDPADAQKQLRDAEADLHSASVQLRQEQLRAAASDARLGDQATTARQDAEHTRRYQATDPLLFSRAEITEAELDERLATAQQTHAEFTRQTTREIERSDIALAELSRQRAQIAADHARAALAHLEVHAPGDGVFVLQRDDHGDIPHLGAQLSSDTVVGEIPLFDQMEAELFVLEADGAGLEVGQAADILVESSPDTAFHGTVQRVDKLAKPREPGVLLQYFSAVVALERADRAVMKPGQRVRATLVLDQRDALVVPRQAVVERGGKTVVYRRDSHGFSPVGVEIAAATPGRVAIVAGLADGDVIAARDPSRTPDSEPAPGDGSAAAPKGSP